MKVKELKKKLETLDDNVIICIEDEDGEAIEVASIEVQKERTYYATIKETSKFQHYNATSTVIIMSCQHCSQFLSSDFKLPK